LVAELSVAGCRQPAIIEAVTRKLAVQCQDLDPGEVPPTEAANRAWKRALWSLLTPQADPPLPSVSVFGDGAVCLEWCRDSRSAFLIVEASGSTRLRRLDVAERGAPMSEPVTEPEGHDLVDAISWATGR